MKKLVFAILGAVFAAQVASASTSWTGSFVFMDDGGGNVYYDLNVPTANPDFTGNLYSLPLGYSLSMNAEINAFADGGDDFTSMTLYYRVDGGSWNNIVVPDGSIIDQGGGNFRGNATGGDLSGLGLGVHTLDVYLGRTHTWDGGSGGPYETFLNTTGDIGGGIPTGTPPTGDFFNASFTVVPEPSTIALALLGVAGFVVRRRMTK